MLFYMPTEEINSTFIKFTNDMDLLAQLEYWSQKWDMHKMIHWGARKNKMSIFISSF